MADPEARLSIRGRVLLPDGAPAPGAVVVTSAGGEAVTDAAGLYALAVDVPLGVESLAVSAFGAGDEDVTGGLPANSTLSGGFEAPLTPGTSSFEVDPIVIESTAGCNSRWLPAFGSAPGVTSDSDPATVQALAVFDDGSGPALYVGGELQAAGSQATNGVARWDGHAWSSLSVGPSSLPTASTVTALAVHDDGHGKALFAAGSFSGAFENVARWDGSQWSSLDAGVDFTVRALTVHDDGSGPKLIAAGTNVVGTSLFNGIAVWDGSHWSPLGAGISGGATPEVRALASFDDGTGPALVATGSFTVAGGVAVNQAARWNGGSWTALGAGVFGDPRSVAVFDAGAGPELYVAGSVGASAASVGEPALKWNGSAWQSLPTSTTQGNLVQALTVHDDGSGPALFAAGQVNLQGLVGGLAKWNGTTWTAIAGANATFSVLRSADLGTSASLYCGGQFSSVAGVPALGVAGWKAGAWFALGSGLNDRVVALTTYDDGSGPAVYASGEFSGVDGKVIQRVARWDGIHWTAVGKRFSAAPLVLGCFDDGSGPVLVAGGDFDSIGGQSMPCLAKWDGIAWSPIGQSSDFLASDVVAAMTAVDFGAGPELAVGGSFASVDGVAALNVAHWNGSTWAPLGFGLSGGGGPAPRVSVLAVADDGLGPTLFAGGSFQVSGVNSASCIAKWDGFAWQSVGIGLGSILAGNEVRAIVTYHDGFSPSLYAAGRFLKSNAATLNHIARWSGSAWVPVGGGFGAPVNSLFVYDDGRGALLYAGGLFNKVGGKSARKMAAWNGLFWASTGAGFSAPVRAMTGFHTDSGPAIVAGGDFLDSTAHDSFLALWGCSQPPPSGLSYCQTSVTTHGCVPGITGVGAASASAGSGFELVVSDVEGGGIGMLYYGTNGPAAYPWFPGSSSLICLRVPFERMGASATGGTFGSCAGVVQVDWNQYIATHPTAVGQPFTGGEVVRAQGWFRDLGAPGGSNLSNALIFSVLP